MSIAEAESVDIPGIDYGIRPAVMLVGDMEFSEFISEHLDALGYGYVPSLNRPIVTFMFDTAESAKSCFGRFKHWIDASADEDALRITFVRLSESEYGLCLSQDMELLENRLLSTADRELYEPFVTGVSHLKIMPISSLAGINLVKEHAGKSTFRFECQTRRQAFPELSFDKFHVNYFTSDEYERQDETLANVNERLVVMRHIAKRRGSSVPTFSYPEKTSERPMPTPHALSQHRNRLLKRFFPVTLERLSFHKAFRQITGNLEHIGYESWQIRQAACNLTLLRREPDLFSASGTNQTSGSTDNRTIVVRVLDHLVETPESIARMPGELLDYSPEDIERQIELDSRYLLQALNRPCASSVDRQQVQLLLKEAGFLTPALVDPR